MLSVFPELLAFGLVGPFALRIVLGVIFAASGFLLVRGKNRTSFVNMLLGFVEIVGAILLIAGLWTQVAALVLTAVALFWVINKYKNPKSLPGPLLYYLLILVTVASLVFTGAGFFSIDLPL